jgi:photosystem II protein
MATISQKAVASRLSLPVRPTRKSLRPVASGGGKVDITKVGLEGIQDPVVQQNLKGRSRFMKAKGWVDPQGRKGKGLGVYRFEDKYGANVDGYSPIYTPDQWADSGDSYKLGTKGLIAWAGLVLVLLGVGINLVISTSQLNNF